MYLISGAVVYHAGDLYFYAVEAARAEFELTPLETIKAIKWNLLVHVWVVDIRNPI